MMNQLFEKALNIREPYYIKDIKFDDKLKRLDIHVDFRKGSKFKVRTVEGVEVSGSAYDTVEKTWRHLNFFEHECYLHARVPRVKHDKGINQAETPWEGIASGFTLLFEALMIILCLSMPVNKVSRLLHVSDDKIWRTLNEYVQKTLRQEDHSGLTAVGIDETSIAKGHDYITLFVDLVKRKTIFVADGKDKDTISDFVDMLAHRNGKPENIKEVTCDMSPAFISGINDYLKSASITFDRFHVMKLITGAVDLVRREEIRTDQSLKKMRYLFLRNEESLSEKDKAVLKDLRLSGLGLKTLKAHQIKESFRSLYAAENREMFEILLKKWYFWATHSRLGPIIEAAKSIKRHWDGIVHWQKTGYSNAVLEGINSVVQAVKSRARGYANVDHFKTMVFLMTGKMDFSGLNPGLLPT